MDLNVNVVDVVMSSIRSELLSKHFLINPKTKLSFLVSTGIREEELKKIIKLKKIYGFKLHLDSGAFENYNKRRKGVRSKKTSLKKFLVLLEKYYSEFDVIYTYDFHFEPGKHEQNWRIKKFIESKGYKTVPVLHDYKTLEETRFYVEQNCSEVALGFSRNKKLKDIKKICDYFISNNIKVRMLGCGSFRKLSGLPVMSSDSTSWIKAAGMYKIKCFWHDYTGRERFEEFSVSELLTLPCNTEIIKNFRTIYKGEIKDLLEKSKYVKRALINLMVHEKMAESLNS